MTTKLIRLITGLLLFLVTGPDAFSQRGEIQYFRYYDQRGINIFEPAKTDTLVYDGLKLRIGANFTQGFQSIAHKNSGIVPLYELSAGFPLAMANLNIDVQVVEGVRVSLVTYMASHHHNEMWVKGGYFQIDKVSFLKSGLLDQIWKNLTLKVGHMEINYGDAHFRRSDGGNTFWNPFIENNIIDEFTTEIGAELYWQRKGIITMIGATNGEIQGSVTRPADQSPSIYGKLGYDRSLTEKIRVRLTASLLTKSSSINGTLFGGDRTGSNYQFVLEPAGATVAGNAFSGRLNPGFKDDVTAVMINPFVKVGGLELFATLEYAQGSTSVENGEIQFNDSTPLIAKQPKRKFIQESVDVLYRFGSREQVFIGGKWNHVNAELAFWDQSSPLAVRNVNTVSIDRLSFGAGWFITRNILVKGEYVTQKYSGYPAGNILEDGMFSGVIMQGTIAF